MSERITEELFLYRLNLLLPILEKAVKLDFLPPIIQTADETKHWILFLNYNLGELEQMGEIPADQLERYNNAVKRIDDLGEQIIRSLEISEAIKGDLQWN